MPNIFSSANILIPKNNLSKWSVIACDQFTSNIEYWDELKNYIGSNETFLNCIYPEAYLLHDRDNNIDSIHETMEAYLRDNLFNEYKDVYIYVERKVNNGIRKGIVGVIDLEEYDYNGPKKVRPSEETVKERVPVRAEVREGASLDMSHVILFVDDERKSIIESIDKNNLENIYDFDLNMNGGHIEGYLIEGKDKESLDELIREYECRKDDLCYAVGDGNHSLAAAKLVYERYKESHEDYLNTPLRYALVEIENIYDPIQVFKPIHRVIKCDNYEELLNNLSIERGNEIVEWKTKDKSGSFNISSIKEFQNIIDTYLSNNCGSIDYVHEVEDVDKLVNEGFLGLYLPAIRNDAFFKTIKNEAAFARKSFSIGSAREKRYYLETRKLK